MEDLISVVIIAYNMESFIVRAIENVENQTYANIEIVVVDDGSSDRTLALCEERAKTNPRLKVIHQDNSGQSAARKTGVLNATGDYIGFMDADDTIAPDMFEQLLSLAKEYGADIAHCGYTMIRPGGERRDYHGTDRLVIQDHDRGLIDLLEGKMVEPTACTKLYKRSLFDPAALDTDVRINEDLLLNYVLFSKAQTSVFRDVCLYQYWKREGSMSRTMSLRQFADPVTVKKRICQQSARESADVQRVAGHLLAAQYIMNAFSIRTNGYKEYRDVYKESKKELKKIYKTSDLTGNEMFKARLLLYAPFLCKPVDYLYRRLHR